MQTFTALALLCAFALETVSRIPWLPSGAVVRLCKECDLLFYHTFVKCQSRKVERGRWFPPSYVHYTQQRAPLATTTSRKTRRTTQCTIPNTLPGYNPPLSATQCFVIGTNGGVRGVPITGVSRRLPFWQVTPTFWQPACHFGSPYPKQLLIIGVTPVLGDTMLHNTPKRVPIRLPFWQVRRQIGVGKAE